MTTRIYLVFGDLHGRILPAFRLATLWARAQQVQIDGLLQVGDLGYFPDSSRLDKATKRFAQEDPTELGALEIVEHSTEANRVFGEEDCAPAMWFTAGNHEDYQALQALAHGDAFAVDAYRRVLCIQDGRVAKVPDHLRVGALWGVDNEAPNRRREAPAYCHLRPDRAVRLACSQFDVLLTHDAPRDAVYAGAGSADIRDVIRSAQPQFAFFGHYHAVGRRLEGDYGKTQVHHLNGMELGGPGGSAEPGSVGTLAWKDGEGTFEYLPDAWLKTFTRHNWRHF